MCTTLFRDVATVSDEAFAYFTLIRCWDSWESAMKNKEIPGKATKRSMYSLEKSNKKYKGWTVEGLKRFDSIARFIITDRELNMKAEEKFMYIKRALLDKEIKNKDQEKVYEDEEISIYNDLDEDDDSEISDTEGKRNNDNLSKNRNIHDFLENENDYPNNYDEEGDSDDYSVR